MIAGLGVARRKRGPKHGSAVKSRLAQAAVAILVTWAGPAAAGTGAVAAIHERSFRVLEKKVEQKQNLLQTVCRYTAAKADSFAVDPLIQEFFGRAFRYYTLQDEARLSDDDREAFLSAQQIFRDHYVDHYALFYDTVLVGKGGNVFYSVMRNEYVGQNLFTGDLATSSLAATIREEGPRAFVDFQYFPVSEEPAAFFVQPIRIDGRFAGWCLLQWSINELNFLFSPGDGPGRTFETVLVNKEHFLITNSRFHRDATSLALRLRRDNIAAKFEEERGNRLLVDYRGKLVLSHFEVVDYLGSEWLISAKIDENEVITNHYLGHRSALQEFLFEPEYFHPAQGTTVFETGRRLRVDMDEFVRGGADAVLFTRGVATCTALIVARPGQFAYLAHLSPYDAAYQGEISYTDLAHQLVQRLPDYEINRNDYVDMVFYIVAGHTDSIEAITDTILEGGFFLSQIHFLRNPEARAADVYFDVAGNTLNVLWRVEGDGEDRMVLQAPGEETNLEARLKAYLQAADR